MSDNSQLVILKQQIEGLVVGGATIDQIENYLGNLFNAAPEGGAEQAIISTVWAQVQATGHAIDLADTAVAVAKEMTSQRDLIADSLANEVTAHVALKEAVRDIDTDHPEIGRLVEEVEETVWEYIGELERDGIHSDDPGEDIINAGHFGDMFDFDDHLEMLSDFARILFGHSRALPEGMMERLGEFIAEFTAEARELWDVEIAREKVQHETKMKELQLLRQQQEAVNGSR